MNKTDHSSSSSVEKIAITRSGEDLKYPTTETIFPIWVNSLLFDF